MANQGIYREPAPAAGLPFPRAGLGALTAVVIVLAVLAMVMPLGILALAGGGMAGAWRLFRDGGLTMYGLLLFEMVGPIAAGALGAFVLRGKRLPSSLLFVNAGMTFALALIGAALGLKMTVAAISGESVDGEQKARILAEGTAEAMSNDIFGGFVVCGLAVVAAVAAASAVASIDTSRASPKPGAPVPTILAGGLWVLATIVVGVLRFRDARGFAMLPVLPVIVLVTFAILAARKAPALRQWHDADEASRAAGALLVAGLAALLAVLALQRAVESNFAAHAFSAISGESLDAAQRARVLAQALAQGKLGPAAYAAHAVLGTLTFALAFVSSRSPLNANSAVALVLGVLLLGGTFAQTHSRKSAPQKALANVKPVGGVNLPVIASTFSDKSGYYGSASRSIFVAKDGTGDGDLSSAPCDRDRHATVYGDVDATLAMVGARIAKRDNCETQVVFVVTRTHPPDLDAQLGEYALLLGRQGTLATTFFSWRHADADVDGAHPEDLTNHVESLRYTFKPTDTVKYVIDTMTAFETRNADHLAMYSLTRSIRFDEPKPPPPPPSPDAPAGVRQGALQVNGRLPPEVIQRIVGQNLGRFRLCYDQGRKRDPSLAGRMMVKFTIDRSGNLQSPTDAGSDLPDPTTVQCVLGAFNSIRFPQPEGGVVTVKSSLVFYLVTASHE